MSYNYETTCKKCNAKLRIQEDSMNVPGGKDKEQADCPNCGAVVAEFMTSGFIRAYIIQDENKQ